jgi:EAL domain-containing protein (putative c-di-GMP-specific phosphodiesterase class I)
MSERMVGVEALVRWEDPERGLVYPDRFIPAAESSGLIVKLGEWIFATAAAQLRYWHDRYGEFSLAVNISARQFQQPDLCGRLEEILENVKLQPHWVEIEITESMAISDIAHAIDTVHRFKQMGAHIGVDDFGTGHSSLNYLRRFEIDHVKIDRSFIAGIGVEHSDEAIVRTIIAMGRSLGLQIIAEGVETREQLEFLRTHGCDRAQGYLFSRPLDATSLEQRIPQMLGTAPEAG